MKDETELNALLQGSTNTSDFNERLVVPHFAYTESGASCDKFAAAFKWLIQMNVSLPVIYLAARSDPITGESRTKAQCQVLIDAHPSIVYVETLAGGHLS
ncbi:hypothetical protein LMJF_35_0280 [Leishmania major strain Friedlin]|uniref:Uncharacterized protein n=1 Tax=Leishmania major TaxID=5664 RepID=E9AEK5_LEIMA|nr:hypothetical protein LMJF_35_0280 [Leishmania major strain Friedlin]CAG9582380.1 hypothetical_protein_-_conserved [Leishmania major strain Friedlin]CBZ12658.1 hypothetical protein LMJF_35_0280 [Leishmania major strain Friedlin]|eukprot:XP_003722425.1 hypothetical protein LMJF_35_0280 [Leishmania major strain Friedlin]